MEILKLLDFKYMEILKAGKDKRPQEKMLHTPKKTDFLVETMEAGK